MIDGQVVEREKVVGLVVFRCFRVFFFNKGKGEKKSFW